MIITKEELALLPIETFNGNIIVIDEVEQIKDACEKLAQSSIIGFDTETKPAFKKGVSHKVALVQLSTDNECYLFRLNLLNMPMPLLDILNSSKIKKIGLSLKDDFAALHQICPFKPSNFVELQTLVKNYDIEDIGLQRIYGILFDKRITKGQRLTDWEAKTLSESQKMYAAIDAWACLKIYRELTSRIV